MQLQDGIKEPLKETVLLAWLRCSGWLVQVEQGSQVVATEPGTYLRRHHEAKAVVQDYCLGQCHLW